MTVTIIYDHDQKKSRMSVLCVLFNHCLNHIYCILIIRMQQAPFPVLYLFLCVVTFSKKSYFILRQDGQNTTPKIACLLRQSCRRQAFEIANSSKMYVCQASDLLGECYHSYATLFNGDRIQIFNAFQKGLPESLCFTHNTSDKCEKKVQQGSWPQNFHISGL